MKKILKLALIIFIAAASVTLVKAQTGATYYVSTTGADTNPGTSSSPFKTFTKAISVLNPGDTLMIYGGTYTQQLLASKSGTGTAPINIKAVSGQKVLIDAQTTLDIPVNITGSFINLEGLEVARGSYDCVLARGSDITINNFNVHDCGHFDVRTTATTGGGKNITIQNSVITGGSTDNLGGINTTGGWGAGLRVGAGSSYITIRNNKVYNNWGEGIGLVAGNQVNVLNNDVHDNYSVNIYVDNAYDVNVFKNLIYSTNPTYFRSGRPANCISMAEENLGLPAQLARVNIINNIAAFCNRGIGYTYSELSGSGMDTSVIAFNTIWGSADTGILVINVPDKTRNSVIADNIVGQPNGVLADIRVTSGITTYNNFWVIPVKTLNNAAGPGDITGDIKFATVPGITPDTFRLSSSSPAINKGKAMAGVTDDFESKLRDASPDMGADEYSGTTISTASTASPVPTPTAVLGDANGDGVVNESDYSIWAANYGKTLFGPSNGDFNSSGIVDGIDYTIWLNAH